MSFKRKFWNTPDNEGNIFLKILLGSIIMTIIILGYLSTNNLIISIIIIGSFLSIWLAYYYPTLTIVLLIVFGQFIQFEFFQVIQDYDALPWGDLNLRFSDPILFGIVSVFLIKALKGDATLKKILFRKGKYFTIFLAFVLIQVFRNWSIYGTYAFGEFRTYYQGFLILPYIVLQIKTPKARIQLFIILMILALSQIMIAFIKGVYIQKFSLNSYEKWLSSFGALGLLYGLFSFYLYRKLKGIKLPQIYSGLIFFSGILIIIIASNRSVWLAGVSAFMFLILTKEIQVKHHIALFFITISVFLITTQIFTSEGYDFYNFFAKRLYAFTDFQKDPTSAWRYYVWMSIIENIKAQPFLGYGLGSNFNIYIPEFASFFGNSPHNFYLSMLYELGLIGTLLFTVFLVKFVLDLKNINVTNSSDYVVKTISYIVITSLLSYWIAYSTEKDFFTWCFLGLGFSIIINYNNYKNSKKKCIE